MAAFNIYISLPEQQKILAHGGGILNVGYADKRYVLHTVFLKILRNLTKLRPTVVVVPDADDRHLLMQWIKKAGVSDLVMAQNPVSPVSPEKIYHAVHKPSEINAVGDAGFTYGFKVKKALNHYSRVFSENMWEGMTWRQLLDTCLESDADDRNAIFHAEAGPGGFLFSADEYNQLTGVISEALFHYSRDFEWAERQKGSYMPRAGNHLLTNIDHISNQVFRYRELAVSLRDRYYQQYFRLEENYLHDVAVRAEDWALRASRLQFTLSSAKQDSQTRKGLVSWLAMGAENDRSTTQILKELAADLMSAGVLNVMPSNADYSQPLHLLEFWMEAVRDWQKTKKQAVEVWLRSVNRLNHEDPSLAMLENEAHSLISQINALAVTAQKYEMNTLSFRKQMEYVSSLAYDLDVIMESFGRDLPYYKWMAWLDEQDQKTKKVITLLRRFDPADWLDLFDSWYYFELLRRHLGSENPIGGKDLDLLTEDFERSVLLELAEAYLHFHKTACTLAERQKTEFPDLWQLIHKKKSPYPVTLGGALEKAPELISAVWPVLILENDSIDKLAPGYYNELISLAPDQMNVEIMQSFEAIISMFPEGAVATDIFLKGCLPPPETTLSSLNIGQRLQTSRSLAHMLLSFGAMPTVMQLRHGSIISFASPLVNDEIVRLLYHTGIKKLYPEKSMADLVTTCLSDAGSTTYIFTESGLVDPTTEVGMFHGQRQLLSLFAACGCVHIDIDVIRIMKQREKYIESLLIPVLETAGKNHDPKNQLQLEFD